MKHGRSILFLLLLSLSLAASMALGTALRAAEGDQATNNGAGVEITNVKVSTATDSAIITWETDATGTLQYGTTSGTYENEKTTSSGTLHSVRLDGLTAETTHYFVLSVVAIDESTATTDEQSFVTESVILQFRSVTTATAGPDEIFVTTKTNQLARVTIQYGTSADDFSETATPLTIASGTGAYTWHFVLKNLAPDTTYFYQATATQIEFWHGKSDTATSDVVSAATTKLPSITSIKPETGTTGTVLTIKGKNFGTTSNKKGIRGVVAIGCKLTLWPNITPPCANVKILSWSDTKVRVRITKRMSTGAVYLGKAYTADDVRESIFVVKGPKFRVY